MDKNFKNKRILENTLLLYLRMAIVMIVNLYSVRLVLNALGVIDYGIYNVIAGVIMMLSSVSSVLSTSTLRFYSFSIGSGNNEKLQDIFSVSLSIFCVFSIIVVVVGETIGLWLINTQLVIPEGRLYAANWLYQFTIFTFIISFFSVPFSSAIIAHENIIISVIITTSECILKLLCAGLLLVINYDRLIVYGALMFVVPLLGFSAYITIGIKRYSECRFRKQNNSSLYKELLSFSG